MPLEDPTGDEPIMTKISAEEEAALTPQHVTRVFADCLFRDDDPSTKAVAADGIVNRVHFESSRLAGHAAEIRAMLAELPEPFRTGGWSFLNACDDRNGDQWTGEHRVMEQLFLLGMAAGLVSCLMPRELWEALPGGMPYYAVAESAAVDPS